MVAIMATTNANPRGWTIGAYLGQRQYACRKVPHASEGSALAHIRATERRENGWGLHAYPCPNCRSWHVGRRRKEAQ